MQITMTGETPLLMHNVRLADPHNFFVKEINRINGKRAKDLTSEDQLEIDRLKFAGGMYHDDELGPFLPAENIFKCLIEAARKTRQGKHVEGGVLFSATKAPLHYDGPRDIDGLWGDGDTQWVDRRMVTINRQKVPSVRPIFPQWAAQIEVELDTQMLDEDTFADIVHRAGQAVKIGDYRRFYGRFNAQLDN